MCFFSIIVPVYNVEKYLSECIDSVLRQSFKDWELILLNDGSKDASGEICLAYVKGHKNIKYISKENTGVSDTRNLGIEKATGKYILCLDSDDLLSEHCLEKLYQTISTEETTDIWFCNYIEDRYGIKSPVRYEGLREKFLSAQNCLELIERVIDTHIINAVWNKVYKTEFLHSTKCRMGGLIYAEDFDWNLGLLLSEPTIRYIEIDTVIYRWRTDSITHSVVLKKELNKIAFCEKWYRLLPKTNCIVNYLAKLYLSILNSYSKFNKIDRIELKNRYHTNKRLLKSCTERQLIYVIKLSSLMGLYACSLFKRAYDQLIGKN